MIKYKKETVERDVPISVTCDVCKNVYGYEGDGIMEVQEFTHLNFQGGYCSVFGDMNLVKLDICQHCLKEKLGDYLEINEGEDKEI